MERCAGTGRECLGLELVVSGTAITKYQANEWSDDLTAEEPTGLESGPDVET